jgi:hypothetical protein
MKPSVSPDPPPGTPQRYRRGRSCPAGPRRGGPTDLQEDCDQELLQVRIYIGQQSIVVTIANLVVDHFLRDLAVQRMVGAKIEAAVAELQGR